MRGDSCRFWPKHMWERGVRTCIGFRILRETTSRKGAKQCILRHRSIGEIRIIS